MDVGPATVSEVTAVPPMSNVMPVTKFVPVRVIDVPPYVAPLAGDIDVIDSFGADGAVPGLVHATAASAPERHAATRMREREWVV
jgi:hypothetical protein